jgi:hypothetical protein
LLLLIAGSLFSPAALRAQDQLFTKMLVNDILEDFSQRIDHVIDNLDTVYTKDAFDTRQHLVLLSNTVGNLIRSNVDNTFDRIDESQQNLLLSIENSLRSMETTSRITLDSVEEIIDKSSVFASSLPLGKRIPVVTSVSPTFTLKEDKELVLKVKGAFLATGRPYVKVGNKKIRTDKGGKIDTELLFVVPLSDFDEQADSSLFNCKLTVYKKGFLFNKKLDYDIGIFIIPTKMGEYELYARQFENSIVTANRQEGFSYKNSYCAGSKEQVWTFNCQEDPWKIDINSIKIDAPSISKRTSLHGLRNVSEKGFQISATIQNSGNCIKVLGQTLRKDSRGSIKGTVAWQETRTVKTTKDEVLISKGDIDWGEDRVLNLPERTESFRLVVRQMDDSTRSISAAANERWFKVLDEKNYLVIKPKTIAEAFAE